MNQSILDIPFRQHRQSMQNVHIIKMLIHIMEKVCMCMMKKLFIPTMKKVHTHIMDIPTMMVQT